jgi:hypothetical protein
VHSHAPAQSSDGPVEPLQVELHLPPAPQSIVEPPQLSVGPLHVIEHGPAPQRSVTSPHAS